MLIELDGTGFTSWCSRIRSVLELTRLDQAWGTQPIGNTNKLMLSLNIKGNYLITAMGRYQMSCVNGINNYYPPLLLLLPC